MLNLKVLEEIKANITQESLKFISSDPTSGYVFGCTDDSVLVGFSPNESKVLFKVNLESDDLIAPGASVVGVQYVPDLESVVIATNEGDIVTYNVATKEAECVGAIDSGIVDMAWSPDFEEMLLATGNSTILAMTNDWDVSFEVAVFPKKNSDGVYDAEQTELKEEDNAKLEKATLSWRGDGKFFVSSAQHPITKETVAHVWERAGTHSAVCEDMAGVHTSFSWRPSGNVIAAIKNTPAQQKTEVIFYERNGLRHYEFLLPDVGVNDQVVSLTWNCDSDLLAVHLRTNEKDIVQLWSTSNYKWYLKQEFVYSSNDGQITNVVWDQEDGSILRVASSKGLYFQYSAVWETTISPGVSPSNPSTACVINGAQVLFTPFRFMVMPPPMSASSIQTGAKVRAITFSPSYRMLILGSDGSLELYSLPTSEILFPSLKNASKASPPNFSAPPTLISKISIPDELKQIFSSTRQLELISDTTIIGLASQLDEGSSFSGDVLFQVSIANNDQTLDSFTKIPLFKRAIRLFHNKDVGSVVCESVDGSLLRVVSSAHSLSTSVFSFVGIQGSQLPFPCRWLSTTLMGGKEVVIALDKRNKLVIDGRLASSECNSFALHNEYLLFTTLSHTLRFVRLKNPFDGNIIETKAVTARSDDTVREVERGSRLITVVPYDTRVVLQMPRGNLEGIAARPLTLSSLRTLLDSNRYGEAFIQMRKHRIDLNFIHDHNPTAFVNNVKTFIEQVNDVNYINLFLSSLREEDVTKTLFPNPDNQDEVLQASVGTSGAVQGKVNKICKAMREELLAINREKFLLSILTTYVKNNPPELEEVLLVIKELRDKELASTVNILDASEAVADKKATISSDEALKYVIFLADVEKMYDVALGMYDFDLAALVAQKSHKDPKEYLPFLNKLREMETYYQRYSVDIHLEKWAKALKNLSQAGEQYFQRCIDLTVEHNLYPEATEIFANDREKLNIVLEHHASYLVNLGNLTEAGLIFVQCGNDREALTTFKRAVEWRMAMSLALKISLPPEEVKELANELADTLKNLARFDEAASLYFNYCDSPAQGISSLIAGNQWFEALEMIYKYKLMDVIEDELRPAIQEAYEINHSTLDEKQKLFERHAGRLQIVRTNKLLYPKLVEEGGHLDEDLISLHSEATSIASSLGSRTGSATSRSSRKSRRSSRKRLTAKEGGPHEEEYLMTTMKAMLPTQKLVDDIVQLIKVLVYFENREEAKNLQSILEKYIETVNQATILLLTSEREINTPPGQQHPPFPTSLVSFPSWKLSNMF